MKVNELLIIGKGGYDIIPSCPGDLKEKVNQKITEMNRNKTDCALLDYNLK